MLKTLELLKSKLIKGYDILDFKQGEDFYFLKIKAVLIDNSVLHVREYASEREYLYSYHWQDEKGSLRIRWDNSPHHKHIKTFLVLGIDAATWSVITPNLSKLSNFERLIKLGKSKVITLTEKPISASIWCGMFSGKLFTEHKHESYVVNGDIVKRADINVDFIWDILHAR